MRKESWSRDSAKSMDRISKVLVQLQLAREARMPDLAAGDAKGMTLKVPEGAG